MEYDLPPEGEEVQRRVYEALLPHVGKPMTPEITEIIKEVLSQAAKDGLLNPITIEQERQMPDFMKLYLEFWAPLVEDEAGIIDKTQLAKELYDYYHLITKCQHIMPYVTGNVCTAASDVDTIKMEADIFYAKLYLGEDAQEVVDKFEAMKPTIH